MSVLGFHCPQCNYLFYYHIQEEKEKKAAKSIEDAAKERQKHEEKAEKKKLKEKEEEQRKKEVEIKQKGKELQHTLERGTDDMLVEKNFHSAAAKFQDALKLVTNTENIEMKV